MKKAIKILIILLLFCFGLFYIWGSLSKDGTGFRCPHFGEYTKSNGIKKIQCLSQNKSKFCMPLYRTWIMENCPGISFN